MGNHAYNMLDLVGRGSEVTLHISLSLMAALKLGSVSQ